MGSQAFLILTWCLILTLNIALGEDGSKGKNAMKDSIAEASISRLYRNLPIGVYASASPYAAYSFHVPNVLAAPQSPRVIPVNEESVFIQAPNGYLRDSYGNKFAGSTQMSGLKAAFPQQFVQLQALPAHLSQPLVSAAPSFNLKQTTPHFFAPGQFGVQRWQASSPAPFSRYAAPNSNAQSAAVNDFAAPPVVHVSNPHLAIQQQQSRNQAIFVNTQAHEQYNRLKNEPKFQRLQENVGEQPNSHNIQHVVNDNKNYNRYQSYRVPKQEQQAAPAKDTKVTTYVNGKKSVVTLETKPPLPLLDISLLEPLTFDNPLVPQVQHFLPRINDATYHKLPDYRVEVVNKNHHDSGEQQARSYDSEIANEKSKSKNKSPKKKQKEPQPKDVNENNQSPPSISVKGVPNVGPEYSYEINSPNYKETYKEQVVSYNKETQSEPVNYSYNNVADSDPINYSYKKKTQSEPVHYTYEKQVQNKPVHYSYVHSSKAPKEEKQVYYENEGQGPKQLIYTIKSDDKNSEPSHGAHRSPSNIGESHEYSSGDDAARKAKPINDNIEHEEYADAPQSDQHLVPEHRQQGVYKPIIHDDVNVNNDFPKSFMDIINAQAIRAKFQPITPDYNKDESLLPKHKPHERIRVDPNQHVQRPQQGRPSNPQNDGYSPNQYIREKSKRIIIRDETPDGIHSHNEKQSTETVDQEENNEENFERACKNAAFGFPAYESRSEDIEKDIYNPESYVVPQDEDNFDNEHIPFEQYYQEGDKFPKFTHSNYKDARDKVKEDYYLDFSINKPESMLDRYKNKVAYYKMFKGHRPEGVFNFNQNSNAEDGRNAKFTVAPTYSFVYANEQKPKNQQQFARLQSPQQFDEFDYEKEVPPDNAAYGSQPYQRLKTKTQFVEPQFQYGFEPSPIQHLLDSELATMASNDSPESEKPGTRKKMYEENWYIKKTTTSGGNAGS